MDEKRIYEKTAKHFKEIISRSSIKPQTEKGERLFI